MLKTISYLLLFSVLLLVALLWGHHALPLSPQLHAQLDTVNRSLVRYLGPLSAAAPTVAPTDAPADAEKREEKGMGPSVALASKRGHAVAQGLRDSGCRDRTLGQVKEKRAQQVYKWVDEQGVTHFSDADHKSSAASQIAVQADQRNDYYALNLKTHGLHPTFSDQLRSRVHKSFEVYQALLGKDELRKIAVNMQIFADKAQYERHKDASASSLKADVPGYYSSRTNESVLLFRGEQQTLITAVHEAAHSITTGIIGSTSPWLTEGISEYLENIEVILQYAQIAPSPTWTASARASYTPVPLAKLFAADADTFYGANDRDYYGTSWAFIYFLMDAPERRQWLAKILRYEKANRCGVELDAGVLRQLTGLSPVQLQRTFDIWLKNRHLLPHRI